MRGTPRKISLPRRLVADLMYASVRVPLVTLTRPLNVSAVIEARAQAGRSAGWAAIFVKAFALVAKSEPILRTLYVRWPWPALYELPRSVGMVAIARVENGEDCVMFERVCAPDQMTLADIDALIRRAKTAPLLEVDAFRRSCAWNACAAAAAAGLGDRDECRPATRQFLRQLWRDLGRGLWFG